MGLLLSDEAIQGVLESRTTEVCEQLTRYSGHVFNPELLDVLEMLAEINDDLYHARSSDLIQFQIRSAKTLLDKLGRIVCCQPTIED